VYCYFVTSITLSPFSTRALSCDDVDGGDYDDDDDEDVERSVSPFPLNTKLIIFAARFR